MGASLWGQVGLPLLIGLAIQIVATALCFLSVRIWNCFMKQLTPQTAVGASAYDQTPPDSEAAAHANGVPDLEMGNGYGPAEGGFSIAESELDLGIVEGDEGRDYFSDQEAHPPAFESPVATPQDRGHESRSKWRSCAACRNVGSSFATSGSQLIMVLQECRLCGHCSICFSMLSLLDRMVKF